jgi:hypothetical protein
MGDRGDRRTGGGGGRGVWGGGGLQSRYRLQCTYNNLFKLARRQFLRHVVNIRHSVADPDLNLDPDPPDPHVFGPPGSGSISQRYGSGSRSGSF